MTEAKGSRVKCQYCEEEAHPNLIKAHIGKKHPDKLAEYMTEHPNKYPPQNRKKTSKRNTGIKPRHRVNTPKTPPVEAPKTTPVQELKELVQEPPKTEVKAGDDKPKQGKSFLDELFDALDDL